METKKRTTKLTLGDIPKVGSPFRSMLINKLTELDIYKEALGRNAALGFSTEELKVIEEKYKEQKGLFNEDIQNEISKKGWLLKPTTIKQYIQKNQLPMPKERRRIKGKGAVSLYPIDFIRHLNFVRFMLNAGREICERILEALTAPPSSYKMSDYSFLQSMYYGKEIYDGDERYDDFFTEQCEWGGPRFIEHIIKYELAPKIALIKFAEAVLDGDKKFKFNNDFDASSHGMFTDDRTMPGDALNPSIKLFNAMKAKLEFPKKVDKQVYTRVRTRLQEYLKQLQEISQTLEDVLRRFDSFIEESKNASWT